MAITTANVEITTDSFQNWLDKTNTLLGAYSTTIVTTSANSTGGLTTGNATVNGVFTANSLTVSGNSTFGLRGGDVTTSNVLFITSNVSIGNATVNTVFTTTTIDTDLGLSVLGSTVLSNSVSVAGNSSFTGNATFSGSLQIISGNTNFDSGTLFVDATNNRIGINNTSPEVSLRVTGDVDISSTANIQGSANVAGLLGVVGNTTLSGSLQTISGNVNIDTGTLFVDSINNRVGINNTSPAVALVVTGAADISLTANIQGNANVGGTLGVLGVTTITGNTILNGALQTISGNTNLTGTLVLAGNASFSNTLALTGAATLSNNITVAGVANLNSTVNITGAANISNNIAVTGTATVTGNTSIAGGLFSVNTNIGTNANTLTIGTANVSVDGGTLFVDSLNNRIGINNTAPGVALRVTGAADISLTANVQGNANVGGTLGVVGSTTITGNTTLNGSLQTISGNVNIDSGVLFVDSVNNRVGINNTAPGVALVITGAANVSTSVNSALLTVGTSFVANTLGAYHTGIVNAASFRTTGSISNTTAIVPTSNTILLGNTTGRWILNANSGNFSGDVVVSGTSNVGSSLNVAGNVTINTFATFLTLANTDLGTNTTNSVTAVSFPKANYRAGEVLVHIVKGSEYQITKILFAHDGTDVNQTIFGTLMAPSSSQELANNIVLSVNLTDININMIQRALNTSVKVVANMIS